MQINGNNNNNKPEKGMFRKGYKSGVVFKMKEVNHVGGGVAQGNERCGRDDIIRE